MASYFANSCNLSPDDAVDVVDGDDWTSSSESLCVSTQLIRLLTFATQVHLDLLEINLTIHTLMAGRCLTALWCPHLLIPLHHPPQVSVKLIIHKPWKTLDWERIFSKRWRMINLRRFASKISIILLHLFKNGSWPLGYLEAHYLRRQLTSSCILNL